MCVVALFPCFTVSRRVSLESDQSEDRREIVRVIPEAPNSCSAMIPVMHLGSTILSAVIGRSARATAAHLMLIGQQPNRTMASSSAALQIKALREKSGAPISDVKVVGYCR